MKKSLIVGLIFGLFMAVFFIIFDILVQDQNTNTAIIVGSIKGVLAGTLFSFTIHLFTKRVDKVVQIPLNSEEEILFQTKANHFKGLDAVGGKLFLTNQRLVFKSHSLNIQNHTLSIPREKISGVQRYKGLGFINRGLTISIEENTIEKFVVDQAAEWQIRINQYNNAAASAF